MVATQRCINATVSWATMIFTMRCEKVTLKTTIIKCCLNVLLSKYRYTYTLSNANLYYTLLILYGWNKVAVTESFKNVDCCAQFRISILIVIFGKSVSRTVINFLLITVHSYCCIYPCFEFWRKKNPCVHVKTQPKRLSDTSSLWCGHFCHTCEH